MHTQTADARPTTVHAVEAVPATREGVLLFARLMATVGRVKTIAADIPDLSLNQMVVHAPDEQGLTLAFMAVTDGEPEVSSLNFDFGDRASRHLIHTDGQGLTLCDFRGKQRVHYRLPDAA